MFVYENVYVCLCGQHACLLHMCGGQSKQTVGVSSAAVHLVFEIGFPIGPELAK